MKSYPLVLVGGVAAFVFFTTVMLFLQDHKPDLVGLLIFYGVFSVFLVIHMMREVVFDDSRRICTVKQYNVFKREQFSIPFDDIEALDIRFGRGNGLARGGALVLMGRDSKYVLVSHDLQAKHVEKLKGIKTRIEAFISAE